MKLCTSPALLFAASASAATISLNPFEDAFVSSANATSNYGGAGSLSAAAVGLPKGEFQSVLKFDLASAKTTFDSTFGAGLWAIDSITLQLTATAPNNPIFNGSGTTPANSAGQFSLKWMQSDSWTEGNGTPAAASTTGGVVYATLPSFLSGADESLGTFSFGGGTSGNTTWSLGLAPSFRADVTGGNSVSLLMLPADAAVSMLVNSRTATLANRPLLTVNASAVPEPGTSALLAGAAVMWLARRRRHEQTA